MQYRAGKERMLMKLEKGIISNQQMAASIGVFIQGSLFCTTFLYKVAYRDIWLSTLSAFAAFAAFSCVYFGLLRAMPGKSLIEIDDLVFGPYVGKVVSSVYIFFFVTLAVANIRFVCDFALGLFMDETPLLAFAVMYVLLSAWAVNSGLEVVVRTGLIFLVIVSASIALIFVFNLNNMDYANFLPLFRTPMPDFLQLNHIIFSIFFGEIFVFMMIIPYVGDQSKIKKSYMLGIVAGEATLLTVSVIITSTMGGMSTILSNPIIVMVREINMAKVITRIEFLTMAVILFSAFIKITVIFYASALGLGQVLNLRSYRPLVLPLSAVLISLTIPMFDTPAVQALSGKNTWPFYASIFEFILPAITLITAKLRRISPAKGS